MSLLLGGDASERNLWQVDCTKSASLVDVASQCVGDLNTDGALRLLSATTNVRGQDEVLDASQVLGPAVELVVEVGTVSGRLIGVDIDCSTSNLAALHGVGKCLDVDNATS